MRQSQTGWKGKLTTTKDEDRISQSNIKREKYLWEMKNHA